MFNSIILTFVTFRKEWGKQEAVAWVAAVELAAEAIVLSIFLSN